MYYFLLNLSKCLKDLVHRRTFGPIVHKTDYIYSQKIIRSLKVNDTAKHEIKFIEKFSFRISKNEEQKLFLLRVSTLFCYKNDLIKKI